ncbi:MAG: hypothetical protein WCE62_17300 [Polyangiales bacterium]
MRWIIILALAVLVAPALGCSRSAKPTLMANMTKKTEIPVSQLRAIEGEPVGRPTSRARSRIAGPPEADGHSQRLSKHAGNPGDMNDRVTTLTQQATVEARWQAGYLITSLFDDDIHEDIETVVDPLRAMTGFLRGPGGPATRP